MNSKPTVSEYWTIEEKVFLVALSLLSFLEDDVYSPVAQGEDEKLNEDIKANGQITNVFITEDNVVIGGRRICKALKANRETHAKAQRVKIEPKYRPMFLFSSNQTRLKTKKECYNEVKKILEAIPRYQPEISPVTNTPIVLSPAPISTHSPATSIPVPAPTSTPSPVSTIAIPAPISTPKPKRPTPIQKAVEIADNGTNSTEFQRMQFIERVDKKYGTKLLELTATKCPNIDKVWKAAQKVEKRNKQKNNPTPAIKISATSGKCNLYNKSNWKMDEVENESIDFEFVSPPYFNQIEYDQIEDQIGQEKFVALYIENLVKSFTEVFKKTKPTGNCFVNLMGTFHKNRNILVEQLFIIAMCKIGWHYEMTFIWLKKGGGKRSGNKERRPENSYEPIFWFTKTSDYYYKPIEIPIEKDVTVTFKAAETRVESKGLTCYDKIDVSIPFTSFKNVIKETDFLDVIVSNSAATDSQFMNKLYGEHPAPFPMALPLPFLLQFCPDNGRVLEPYLGRGAGLVSPLMLGHTCYGYDTVPMYVEMAQKLLADVQKDIEYYGERMKELELEYQNKFKIAA